MSPLVPEGFLQLINQFGRDTDKQIELVSTFADQAAIAIENVRLFESVEARTRELAKSLEELHTIQDRLVQTQKLASLGQLTAASEKFYFGHVPELCWLGSAVISLSSKAVQVRAKKPSPSCLHTFSVCLITRHNERQPCHRSRNS